MDHEEFERKLEFILQQQAKFDADIQSMKEEDAKLKATLTRAARAIDQLANLVLAESRDNSAKTSDFDAKIAALVDGQIRLDSSQEKRTAELNARIDAMDAERVKSQSEFYERIDLLEAERLKSERDFYARLEANEAERLKSERDFYARLSSIEKTQAKRDRAFNAKMNSLAISQAKTDGELRKLIANWNRSGRQRSKSNKTANS